MADIDNLNFKVILDNADFDKVINADIKLAEKLGTTLSKAVSIKGTRQIISDKGVQNAKEMALYLDQIHQKLATMPKGGLLVGDADKLNATLQQVSDRLDKIINKQNQHTAAARGTNSQLLSMSSVMRTLAQLTGATFSVIGIRRFLSSLIDITGQFEVQKMALRTMLQDVAAADRIFRQLYEFSSDSTYRFSELAKYAKQLSAFNIGKDNLLETTKMLGDVASGVGVSMDRLILAYGHVKSSGFLRGIQLRSFSQNGVPILEELSKMFTEIEGKAVSLGDVFDKMMKREIPFEMVEEAFRRMTSEGGKFYQMQEVLSKTLAGQINILKGKWENALYAIGQANDGILKGGVKALRFMVEHLQEIGAALKPVIAGFGMYGLALAGAAMGKWVVGAARAVEYFIILTKRTNLATAALRVFGSTTKAVAVGLGALSAAIVIIVSLIQATGKANRELEKFRKELDEIHETARENNAVDAEVSKIESLYKVLSNTNNAYDARKAALDQLKTIVPGYHAQLTEEGRLINNNKAALDKYIEALNREAKMKGAQDELTELYKKRREVNKELETAQTAADNIPANAPLSVQGASVSGYAFVPMAANITRTNQQLGIAKQKLQDIDNQIASINAEIAETIGTTAGTESYDIKNIVETIKKYDADIKALRDKAKKGKISAEEKDVLDNYIKARKEEADLYEDILGIKYDKDNKPGGGSTKNPLADAISDTKSRISLLEKYRDAFDKLEPFIGEDAAKEWVFKNMGYDITKLDADLEKLIATLRKFGQEGREAADAAEARLGLDDVSKFVKTQKEAEKAQKALEKYQKTIRKWMGEDFNLGGTGFEYDISKAFSEYNTKISEVEEKYIEAVKQAEEAHNGNADAIAAETKRLKELRDAEMAYVRARSQEQVNKLAESYLKDQYLLRGVDMDNLGSMSFAQLKNLRTEMGEISRDATRMLADVTGIDGFLGSLGYSLETLTEDDLAALSDKLPESALEFVRFAKSIKDTGISLDTLQEKIQSAIKKGLKNLDEQEKKSIAKLAKYAAGQVLELANSFKELGDAVGDAGLSDAAQGLSDVADIAKDAAAGFQAGGWIGAAIGGVVSVYSKLFEYAAAYEEAENRMNDAVRETRKLMDEAALNAGVESVFGKNSIQKIENATKNIGEAVDAMKKYREQLETKEFTSERMSWFEWLFSGNDGNRPLRERKTKLENMAKSLGFDSLFDEYGILREDALEAISKQYNKLTSDEQAWIENAIADVKKYKDAVANVKEEMEAVFGEIANSAADNIIDRWVEAGDAALDYADILDDVARNYAKMLIKSSILKNVLNPDEADRVAEMFASGRTDEAMSAIASDMDKLAQMEPVFAQILSAFDPYFNRSDSSSGSGLGSGIKSITEDTANLLASYINAIRADVSYMRVMEEKGWSEVSAIGASMPTLNDYLNQVAANTYDTAQNTQRILSELQSVIGAPGTSGSVVRVQSY